jgi:hypothetical protein
VRCCTHDAVSRVRCIILDTPPQRGTTYVSGSTCFSSQSFFAIGDLKSTI